MPGARMMNLDDCILINKEFDSRNKPAGAHFTLQKDNIFKLWDYFPSHRPLSRDRAAIGLAGAIAPPLYSKIVLKAIKIMAFSTEVFSQPNCCLQTRT